MDYIEALRFLRDRAGYDRGFVANPFADEGIGLQRTAWLCAALGNPQQHYRSVHIAGTKGKGSTAAMLAAVLRTAGYRVGLYTSPHSTRCANVFRLTASRSRLKRLASSWQSLRRSMQPSKQSGRPGARRRPSSW